MGCATACVRYFFFAFNFIFWLLGIAVLAIGIYSRVQNDSWKDLLNTTTIFTAANLLIAAGVIVATIGFLGCCGAIKKYQCMLLTYAILVVFIFILEISAGAYAYCKREKVQDDLTAGLRKGMRDNYGKTDEVSKAVSEAIDWFQKHVKCCGASGPDDWWKQSHWFNTTVNNGTVLNTTHQVPESCCKSPKHNCGFNVTVNSTRIFDIGCVEEGKIFVKGNLWLIGGVGIGIASVQLFGIIFALCLYKAFRDEEKGVGV